MTGDPDGWSRDEEADEAALVRMWTFKDFVEAMVFVNSVAALAEERNHHPDIAIHWNEVTLRLWTHTEGGVTGADIDLARALNGLD